ncbi:hypothetical protein CSA57_14605 [candidate division KSB3 bacterium]|nr:MAG: hypothetical protein CSA57_14605 [candidate division KSB3 bacterium]
MLCASDPLSRSIGLAAINAFWNHPTSTGDRQAIGFDRFEPPGDGLVIVGGFRDAARRLPHARIVEREPKPGDIPVEEATPVIAGAKALVITGQTLMNGSLESLLRLSQPVKRRMLFGPSVTLSPVLLDHGLDELCGFAVWDHDAIERFICESGAMIMRDDLTQARLLCRPESDNFTSCRCHTTFYDRKTTW